MGVGGLGWGTVFELDGDTTLGRNESRGGRLLDRRDYCKLHIVSHYVRALLGSTFRVAPIGLLGDDDAGPRLRAEMVAAGLDVGLVGIAAGAPTLFSFCLVYPDGSGGNLTTTDGAASRLDADGVAAGGHLLRAHGRRAIAIALPEVPLAARRELIRLATATRAMRIASFTAAEISDALERRVPRGARPGGPQPGRGRRPRADRVRGDRPAPGSQPGDPRVDHGRDGGELVVGRRGAPPGPCAPRPGRRHRRRGRCPPRRHRRGPRRRPGPRGSPRARGRHGVDGHHIPHSIDERLDPATLRAFCEEQAIALPGAVRAFLAAGGPG